VYFKNVTLARKSVARWRWSKTIEKWWSDFKYFNSKKLCMCISWCAN